MPKWAGVPAEVEAEICEVCSPTDDGLIYYKAAEGPEEIILQSEGAELRAEVSEVVQGTEGENEGWSCCRRRKASEGSGVWRTTQTSVGSGVTHDRVAPHTHGRIKDAILDGSSLTPRVDPMVCIGASGDGLGRTCPGGFWPPGPAEPPRPFLCCPTDPDARVIVAVAESPQVQDIATKAKGRAKRIRRGTMAKGRAERAKPEVAETEGD